MNNNTQMINTSAGNAINHTLQPFSEQTELELLIEKDTHHVLKEFESVL
jgi:hypothetical protein